MLPLPTFVTSPLSGPPREPSPDALAGLIFIAFGLGSIWIASGYELGTARAMGPGYFPVVLGGLIAILGGSLTVRALLARQGGEGAARGGTSARSSSSREPSCSLRS